MVQTITLSDEVFARLQALARPFEDREPEDVIRRLLDGDSTKSVEIPSGHNVASDLKVVRYPRERGAVVELNGERISATTVPDLCTKVMKFIYSKGLWSQFESLAPYKTSAKRYLFSKTAKHPQGNDFFVPLKYRNIHMEAHKNYETTIKQLGRLLYQLGVTFEYVQ
ncbi:MAG: hypothetical protein PF441_04570 [Desulfuromusa sp.]|jgi:predicted CopG family antitoxin|nr:hypothetical protein [Desulfuromusa sp.]